MKKLFNKPYKKVICILAIIIIIAIASIILIHSFMFSGFSMKPDTDTEYYNSYIGGVPSQKAYNYNYLSYSDGSLMAKNTNCTNIDIYSENGKSTQPIRDNVQIVKDSKAYISNGALFLENNNKEIEIDNNCVGFLFDGNNIAYFKDNNNIYITTVNNPENVKSIENQYCVYYLYIQNGKLYVITDTDGSYALNNDDNDSKANNQYNFTIYDLETTNQLKTCSIDIAGELLDIAICKENFVFYYHPNQCIYMVNFEKEYLDIVSTHKHIKNLTSNGNKIYLVAERINSSAGFVTDKHEDNGLWELDITTGEEVKLSDKHSFDDLLATQNYLYCYTIDLILPRGFADHLNKGYTVQQIPIN